MKIVLLSFCLSLACCVHTQTFQWNNQEVPARSSSSTAINNTGLALVYPDYYEGNPTALGETFHQNLLTGAHQKLPLGTIVKVIRVDNGFSTTVRINDRGAYCDGCVIDLTVAAASQIGLPQGGRTEVMLKIIEMGTETPSEPMVAGTPPAPTRFTVRGGDAVPEYNYNARNNEPRISSRGIDQPAPNRYERPAQNQQSSVEPAQPASPPAIGNSTINHIKVPISPFAVQLGSYAKYANAERHVLSLQRKGFNNVFLLQEERSGNSPLNRVIIAPFHVLEDAQDYVDELQDEHQMDALVLQSKLMEVKE